MIYRVSGSQYSDKQINYSNSDMSPQTFTLYSSHFSYYETNPDDLAALNYGVSAQISVALSNRDYCLLQFTASA